MAQVADYVIANANGATVRADINAVFLAVSSTNSGTSEPSTMYAYMLWVDTTTSLLKLRNAANNAWITLGLSVTASNTVDINGGAIDGTAIGASSATTGAFTTLTTTDNLSIGGSNKELRFYEGSNYVGFEAPALTGDQIWILPIEDGDADQVLATNGSGTLSFATISGTTINNNADNRVITGSGTANTLNGETGLTWDGTTFTADGGAEFNDTGADVDFRVESDGNANIFFVDGGNNLVGIGTNVPTSLLHIYEGDGSLTDDANNHLLVESDSHSYVGIGGGTSSDVGVHFMDSGGLRGRIAYHHSSDQMSFQVAATEEIRVTSDGLTFNGDTAAANALDDYEEGTWTPANGDMTFTARSGKYTKIGNMVTVRFNFTVNAVNTGAVNRIGGLPFSAVAGGEGYGTSGNYSVLSGNVYYAWNYTTGTNAYFISSTSLGTGTNVNASLLTASTNMIGQVTYWVS